MPQYSQTLSLPPSIPSSLSHFLSLSAKHNQPAFKSARTLLKSIMEEQISQVKYQIDEAVNLPRKGKTSNKNKRAKTDHGDQSQSGESQGSNSSKSSTKSKQPEEVDPEERSAEYMAELRAVLNTGGSGGDVGRLKRVVGEALAFVGRKRWEDARRGSGKLAVYRVKVSQLLR